MDALGGWLERAARRADRGITFLDRREREQAVPWPELVGRAREVAGGLAELGVRHGDRVALLYSSR